MECKGLLFFSRLRISLFREPVKDIKESVPVGSLRCVSTKGFC